MNAPSDEPESGGPDAEFDETWGDDEGPFHAWLPRDDRLWLHPSEAARLAAEGTAIDPTNTARSQPARTRVPPLTGSTWLVAVVAALIGALAATGVGVAAGLFARNSTTLVRPAYQSVTAATTADLGAEPINWTAVDDSVAPSVVGVDVDGAAGPASGSGVVVLAANGVAYIVTDRSLLTPDMAAGYIGRMSVIFSSGQTEVARLVGQDPLSGLAVLSTGEPAGLVAADITTISNLQVASTVLAVGARDVESVATGSVSGEDRTVADAAGEQIDGLLVLTMPQASPSADGGPVLDQFGRVVAVTVGLQPADESDEGLTFAVPGDVVLRVASQMIDGEKVTHPWLGIADGSDVPSTVAHALGVNGGVEAGLVEQGSPAGAAGMKPDDILVSFDNKPIDTTGALVADINSCYPGAKVPITYVHDGRTVNAEVEMGDEPAGG